MELKAYQSEESFVQSAPPPLDSWLHILFISPTQVTDAEDDEGVDDDDGANNDAVDGDDVAEHHLEWS